jgi:hypothetical protein
VKTVVGDTKPFTEAETYFADAKFYIDGEMVGEVLPIDIPYTGKVGEVRDKQVDSSIVGDHDEKRLQNESIKSTVMTSKDKSKTAATVFGYVPKFRRKEGESPFVEANKQEHSRKLEEEDISLLKEAVTVPLPKLSNTIPTKQPIKGFVKPTQGGTEHGSLPNQRTKEGFDPNAYKLLAKAGYDFGSPSKEGCPDVASQKVHELDEAQKRLRGGTVDPARSGLGFVQSEPIKISGRRKDKKVSTQHISVEVLKEDDESQPSTIPENVGASTPRVSVFDRVDASTIRTSVFNRISTNTSRTSVFNRLSLSNEVEKEIDLTPHKSVFERIQAPVE